jgi:hypothetical protein
VAVEVFDGNTADPMTLAAQVSKLKPNFWGFAQKVLLFQPVTLWINS